MKFYLEQLICALHDDDINRLLRMDLKRSKIKTYLGILIESRKVGIPDKNEIMEKLEVDENAFRKMRSVILTRCLDELVPEGGPKLLKFLSQYRLHEIFWREADEIIAKMKKDKAISKEDKAMIYLQSLLGYMRLPFSLFRSEKLEDYLKGFSANYNKPDKQAILDIIRLNELFILIVQSFFKVDLTESNYVWFQKEIMQIKERAIQSDNKRLRTLVNGVNLVLDFYYKGKPKELQNDFDNAFKEYASLNDPTTDDEVLALKFFEAYNQVMAGNHKEAGQLFEVLRSTYHQTFHYFPHVVLRYALALMVNGETEKCKKIIDSYLNRNILVYDADGTIMSCLVYTAWNLLDNNVDKAFEYITMYQSVRNKKELFSFEISMRFYEIIYFFQRGDAAFAASQMKKFVRYLEDKANGPGIKNAISVFKPLSVIFNDYVAGRINLNEFEQKLENQLVGSQIILKVMFVNAAKVKSNGQKAKPSAIKAA